jgi:hypothetical protein
VFAHPIIASSSLLSPQFDPTINTWRPLRPAFPHAMWPMRRVFHSSTAYSLIHSNATDAGAIMGVGDSDRDGREGDGGGVRRWGQKSGLRMEMEMEIVMKLGLGNGGLEMGLDVGRVSGDGFGLNHQPASNRNRAYFNHRHSKTKIFPVSTTLNYVWLFHCHPTHQSSRTMSPPRARGPRITCTSSGPLMSELK